MTKATNKRKHLIWDSQFQYHGRECGSRHQAGRQADKAGRPGTRVAENLYLIHKHIRGGDLEAHR